jgi:hypothetical protein
MSVLKADTIQSTGGGAATLTKQIAPKTFSVSAADGTSISASFNISSLSDDGTGLQTFSLTNSMSNTNYAALATGKTSFGGMVTDSHAVGSYRTAVRRFSDDALFDDIPQTSAVGDLA